MKCWRLKVTVQHNLPPVNRFLQCIYMPTPGQVIVNGGLPNVNKFTGTYITLVYKIWVKNAIYSGFDAFPLIFGR